MNDVKAQASRLSSAYKGILMGLLFLPYMRDVTIADLIIHAVQIFLQTMLFWTMPHLAQNFDVS